MTKRFLQENGHKVALLHSTAVEISSAQDALDLLASLRYNDRCERFALNKEAIAEPFFDLRTGLAGEVLQKFVNYRCKFAVIGDFSAYPSTALRDFIRECNRGSHIFFVPGEAAAVEKLSRAVG